MRNPIKTGQVYNRWTAVLRRGRKGHSTMWLCRCQCGVEKEVSDANLKSGASRSCGCYNRERLDSLANITADPVYEVWSGIKQRCFNQNDEHYKHYGGRGIGMALEWKESFESFRTYVGDRPTSDHSIDRKDNDGNYEPGNVRWATKKQQARNKRCNRIIEFNGKSLSVAEWAEGLGMVQNTLRTRLFQKHWPVERAFTEPVRSRSSRGIQS